MGQQQILLILLSVVIVSVAIATGITVFNERTKIANRNAIIQDMYNIASLAIAYHRTPAIQGGGGGTWDVENFYRFAGYPLTRNGKRIQTENGQILVQEIARGRLRINGYGSQIGFDEENAIRARLILSGSGIDDMTFTILN